mgnify:CR=1 FL=1
MEYRKFAEIPEKVSLLGFGGMRFPVRDDQPENIVEEGVQALIDHAPGERHHLFLIRHTPIMGDGQRRSYRGRLGNTPETPIIWLINCLSG